jgi:diguanylate cyclase (GGDEF)-like protein
VNRRFYRDNIYALWSGGAIMLVGIVLLVCDVSMKKRMERRFMRGSTHLGVFLFITGAWVLTDAQAPQIFTNHMALVTLLCYLCFMAMPIALSLFVQEVLSVRRQILDVFSVLQGLILAACLLSYCAGWLPLYCFLIPSCTLTVIHLISILRCGMADAKKTKSRIMRKVVNGVWALFVACCLSLVAFYSDFVMGYAWIYSLGALVFTGLLAAAAIESLYMHMVNRANAQAYQRLAYVDMLTNMANRNAFIEDTKKGGLADRLAYLVFDVNHLKTVNDQYGHQAGDQLIRDAAGSIRAQFDQYGKCYRIGGDEFVVLAQNVTREEIARAVQRWEALVEQINRDRERPMEIACGYAIRTGDSLDLDELYAQADADMYVRKKDMKKK